MKRLALGLVAAGALASFAAAPAQATPLGKCSGKVDAVCTLWSCDPSQDPCTASPVCLVWYSGRCAV
ncbi:MAG TPA: hypothetical protein VF519_00715 [Mycobacteriales bacterium]|jgi:hypothetical protein